MRNGLKSEERLTVFIRIKSLCRKFLENRIGAQYRFCAIKLKDNFSTFELQN